MAEEATRKIREGNREQAPKVRWDDTNMRSSYANVCNVSSTREEMVLFFGISNPSQGEDPEVRVQLSDRIILSPYAAKRLAAMLNNIVQQYELRFGALDAGAGARPETPPSTN